MQERQEGRVVGVLAEAPGNRFDERLEQVIAEMRPAPGPRPHQRRQQNHLALGGTARSRIQHMIDHDRPTGALPAQVPRLRQIERLRFGKQPLQGVLILGEVLDTRPLATGQTVPRQVAGNHRKALIQRPLDHMPVEPGVIVETVEHEQRRLRLHRPPDLADQLVAINLKTPQPTADMARGKIQTVEPLIGLRLR
ncbi:hypothetical protein D3C85_803590 [compost metagenome]